MKHLAILALILLSFTLQAQEVEKVKVERIENILSVENDTLYIINFWATWCKPCIEELPYFEEFDKKYKGEKVKIILVTLDFDTDIDSKVKPFLSNGNYGAEVWFLDETKQNIFIPKVHEKWSGAIPFTVFSKGITDFKFHKEGKIAREDLEKIILENL